MDKRQQTELILYLEEAREITKNETTFREDQGVIKDFIDRFGDDVSWGNIEKVCEERRVSRNGNKDGMRRALYRWRMFKKGVSVHDIVTYYITAAHKAGQPVRACEVQNCVDRDMHGFCMHSYRQRNNCQTLRERDELVRDGMASALRVQEKKPEPEKADWIFGMKCSFIGSAAAVFEGKVKAKNE